MPAQQARRRMRPPRADKVAAAGGPCLSRVSLRGGVQCALLRERCLRASPRRLGGARQACHSLQDLQAHCIQPLLSVPRQKTFCPAECG
jgi:hypothetical protein